MLAYGVSIGVTGRRSRSFRKIVKAVIKRCYLLEYWYFLAFQRQLREHWRESINVWCARRKNACKRSQPKHWALPRSSRALCQCCWKACGINFNRPTIGIGFAVSVCVLTHGTVKVHHILSQGWSLQEVYAFAQKLISQQNKKRYIPGGQSHGPNIQLNSTATKKRKSDGLG